MKDLFSQRNTKKRPFNEITALPKNQMQMLSTDNKENEKVKEETKVEDNDVLEKWITNKKKSHVYKKKQENEDS